MTDSVDKKGSLRVSPELRAWMDEIRAETYRQTHKMPSYRELLDGIWIASGRALEQPASRSAITQIMGREPEAQYPENHRDAHSMLEEILQVGGERANWIVGNLKTFVDAIHSGKSQGRRRRAANET